VINVIRIRTIPGSVPKYSAKPPHTPPTFVSVEERIRRFGPTRLAAVPSTCRAPQDEQKLEYSVISFPQFGQVMAILLTRNLSVSSTIPDSNLPSTTQAGKGKFQFTKHAAGGL
jgi:hypothetical protein